jgi:hypothetical protein
MHQVTLEIEGRIIPNVKMHTRGHSSAMCLGFKLFTEPCIDALTILTLKMSKPMQDLRFPKHQFGLRLPKAIPVLGMTPARSRGHHATLDAVLGKCLIFFCKLDQGTDHLKLSPAHMLMYVAVDEAGET